MLPRNAIRVGLMALGAVLLALGVLSAYIFDAVSDSDEFAARATDAYSDSFVSDLLAHHIATQIVSAEPELVAVQPIIESVTGGPPGL